MKNHMGQRTLHNLIIGLAILLAVSGSALAGTVFCQHFNRAQSSPAVVPDNVITPEKEQNASPEAEVVPVAVRTVSARMAVADQADGEEVTLKIYRNQAEDSTPFQAGNLFPGDTESKAYFLEVSYKGSVTVHFHADIRSGYEKLAEVLKCRISLRDGTQLYDGLMKEMPQSISCTLPESLGATETLVYDVTAYLDTSVGNEYMEKELYADFHWWVNEDRSGSDNQIKPGQSSEPGKLISPRTGDGSQVLLWGTIAGGTLLLLFLFLFIRRKKGGKEGEQ